MSFKCEICRKQTEPATRATRVVVETRTKVYDIQRRVKPAKPEANMPAKYVPAQSQGSEIVHEVLACKTCADGVAA